MKKIFSLIPAFVLLSISSCDKEDSPADNYDLTNSLPAYVTLSSTAAKTVKQGNSTTFIFQMRTAMQQAVTVYYDVTGGGVNQTGQTVMITRDNISATATVNIPNVIVPPATSATATLTLVKAVTADGELLTIGSRNNPETQKVTINITL